MKKLKFMKSKIEKLVIIIFLLSIISCKKEAQDIAISSNDFHKAVDKITSIMVHDIFSPPVASRIYNYSNIAAYEVISQKSDTYKSLAGQLTDLKPIPKPEINENLNFELAALVAYFDVGKQLIFSEDRIITYRDSLYNSWKNSNEKSLKYRRLTV